MVRLILCLMAVVTSVFAFTILYVNQNFDPHSPSMSVFYNIEPRTDVKNHVSQEFCFAYMPNIVSMALLVEGGYTRAENGIYIKFDKYNLACNSDFNAIFVKESIWTENADGKQDWSSTMWLHDQKNPDTDKTELIWVTDKCQGKSTVVWKLS